MLRRTLRLSILLCLLIGGLTLLPMAASAARTLVGDGPESAREQGTVPPGTLPTAAPTEKPHPTHPPKPTARPTGRPTAHPPATATPRPQPTATRTSATGGASGTASIGRYEITRVIGNRLSPVIYALTDQDRLYRSVDDGLRWRYVASRPLIDDFVMSAADPDVLYSGAGVDCTVGNVAPAPFYRSDSQGVGWEELPTAVNLVPLIIDPADPYRLFAADCALPFFSEDGGETWTARPDRSTTSAWAGYRIKDMADAPLADLAKAAGGAAVEPTWGAIYAGGALDSGNSIVAFSNDAGLSWGGISPLDGSGPIGLRVLEADPYVAGRLWVADAQGVWQTNDFGATWTLIRAGLEEITSVGGRASFGQATDLAYAPVTGQLFLASTRGLFVLDADASAWQPISGESFSRKDITSLLITESNPTVLWVNGPDGAARYRVR